jgi:hypothetical protein
MTLQRRARHFVAMPANDNDPSEVGPGPHASVAREYLILLVVLLGVGLFYWLSVLFFEWDKIQTCVTMGKRTCDPRIELNLQVRPRDNVGYGRAEAALR